ncbi:hypothetical protein PHYPSEUDO_007849 [Phytophthora pseudosyringae]|uniref:Uncharacterized protein n=1 Tax=Phytophthora pseudosyringae TaxID=221518 RepID=A0A8T1VFG2_9STRA|nr:hypothetical protein PHYPSEUDO_007849 [Phytophthora pseudosyringae]
MEDEYEVEQELSEQRQSRCSSTQEVESPVVELGRQLVEANTTIAVLTEQLKAAKENQEKLEKELAETRAGTPQLMMELAVAQERLKTAQENQKRLEKQLADAQTRVTTEIPQLETGLAVAREQLKAFDDKFKALKQEHTLQLENIELQFKSMEENFELQRRAAGELLDKAATREAEDLAASSEQLYLAPMMIMPDTSQELICVTFVTGASRDAVDEKIQRLRGQILPGAKAILVESEQEAGKIKQSVVDRGQALVKRKRRENPKLRVDVEFYNEPNKLCTRHADDEATTREGFLTLFRLPFTPLDELVEHVVPPFEAATPVTKMVHEIASPVKKIVDKATPPSVSIMAFPFPDCDPAVLFAFLSSLPEDEQAKFMEDASDQADEFEEPARPLSTQEGMIQRFKTMRSTFVRPGGILGEQMFTSNLSASSVSIDDAKPKSELRSLQDLKPIIGKELELGTTHRGRYVCGWVAIDDAFFGIASSSLLLEDVTGYLVEIAAYGLVDTELPPHERQRVLASKFPKGRALVMLAGAVLQAMLLNNIATCRFKMRDFPVSIEFSGAAVHLDPKYWKGWYRLASALVEHQGESREEGEGYSALLAERVVARARGVLPSLGPEGNYETIDQYIARMEGFVSRMRLEHATSKLLPREVQVLLANPPPEIHIEFPELRGFPDGIDATFARKVLYRAFLDASVNPWIDACGIRDRTVFEKLTFGDKVKRWNGTGAMEILRERAAILLTVVKNNRTMHRDMKLAPDPTSRTT